MKYATSPSTSRCSSPMMFSSSSSLPTPITYRTNCMGAATKCYKYLRKLLKFQQMDFEFAAWQMVFLLASPQKVYRNFQNRKQTKQQFARDDPAFLVLLAGWLLVSSVGFAIVLRLSFFQFFKFFMYTILVDCILVGLCVATVFWFVTNRYLRSDHTQDVEWGYAFDIHLNAFFPPLVIVNFLQLFVYHAIINSDSFTARFFGNTFWLVAVSYYVYITFLGYTSVEILHRTAGILWVLPFALMIYIIFLCAGINVTKEVMSLYHHRVT
ncbi:protein unc-50 homolog [Diachasma alloeum]|uniref:protein unc-50 homolog n=1 Tax=Diachasma alloeum TaxID=454923 RepID=UPI00073814DB|nr:protein unc-50 homolog [Diachasma alloeum]XP_015108853.1 protein unc-50 homolog [Diachasma alloeum]XP_015108854.1 protein unc-50 homolog [Diachasma alloeum]